MVAPFFSTVYSSLTSFATDWWLCPLFFLVFSQSGSLFLFSYWPVGSFLNQWKQYIFTVYKRIVPRHSGRGWRSYLMNDSSTMINWWTVSQPLPRHALQVSTQNSLYCLRHLRITNEMSWSMWDTPNSLANTQPSITSKDLRNLSSMG